MKISRSVDSCLGNNFEINIVVSLIIINIKYAHEYPNSISKINLCFGSEMSNTLSSSVEIIYHDPVSYQYHIIST
jgi:hypothetical protein